VLLMRYFWASCAFFSACVKIVGSSSPLLLQVYLSRDEPWPPRVKTWMTACVGLYWTIFLDI